MIKICIFDLDGTLLDTLGNIAGHMNRTLAKYSLAPFPVSDFKYFVGNGARILTERALRARGVYTPEFFEDFFADFAASYAASPDEGVLVYDGISALLDGLTKRGIRAAVCTNKPDAAAKRSIDRFFAEGTFSDVLGARDGFPLKPAPDGVFALLEKYGIKKEEAVFVGDSDVDMQTAVASGLRGFGALWGFRTAKELTDAGAYRLLSAPTELLSYLS